MNYVCVFFIGNSSIFILAFYVSFYFVDASAFVYLVVHSLICVFICSFVVLCFVFRLFVCFFGRGKGKRKNRVMNFTITAIVQNLTENVNLALLLKKVKFNNKKHHLVFIKIELIET